MSSRQRGILIAATVVFGIGAAIGLILVSTDRSTSPPGPEPLKTDVSSLSPGASIKLRVGGEDLALSVPAGEGATYGTFEAVVPAVGLQSGPIERDGSLETVWITDVNGDSRENAVCVVRNGGSGSYADIAVVESRDAPARFTIRHLPAISQFTVKGYMGHDTVSVRDGYIVCSFPTRAHKTQIRVDRQWSVQKGLNGEIPVKVTPDANVDTSGETVEMRFHFSDGQWQGI